MISCALGVGGAAGDLTCGAHITLAGRSRVTVRRWGWVPMLKRNHPLLVRSRESLGPQMETHWRIGESMNGAYHAEVR